jgi:hypothetical protein
MAKARGLGKMESLFFGNLRRDCRAGQDIAILKPLDQIAIPAAG